jgi:CRP-like cAMP-binding protein
MPQSDTISFETGEILFDTDTPLPVAFFIMEGEVSLDLALCEKSIQLKIGPNQFVGDAAVAVTQKQASESMAYHGCAIASKPVKAVAIPIEDIRRELDSCSPMLRAWFASFVSRVLLVIEELSAK